MSRKETDQNELIACLWESNMIEEGRQRYLETIERKDIQHTRLGQSLIQQLSEGLQDLVAARQQETTEQLIGPKGRNYLPCDRLIVMCSAEAGCLKVIEELFQALSGPRQLDRSTLATKLGEAWTHQIRFETWYEDDKKYAARFLRSNKDALNNKGKYARFAKRLEDHLQRYLDGIDMKDQVIAHLSVGDLLLDLVTKAHPDLLTIRNTYKKGKQSVQVVYWSDEWLEEVENLIAVAASSRPIKRPMPVKPREWSINPETGRLEGGYYLVRQRLYHTAWHPHNFTPSEDSIRSLNVIQNTCWEINKGVHEFLMRNAAVLAPQFPVQRPLRLPAEEWDALSKEQKAGASQQYADESARFISNTSKAMTFHRQMLHADELKGRAFWQPHSFDFRGRLYPSNQMLTNQGDDISKGLIRFHNGYPIGEDGLRALCLHAANCAGKDKLELNARYDYIWNLMDDIMKIDDDVVAIDLIKDADEPICFYAACLEIKAAMAYASEHGSHVDYISHLPVAVDGTCNGLQILSLLGKDKVGAQQTNCTSSPTRNDLYLQVARKVQKIITDDIARHSDTSDIGQAARSWMQKIQNDHVARKTVKRAVMTTSYSVTPEGIREQLVSDRHCDSLEIPANWSHLKPIQARHRLAGYYRDVILVARTEAVTEAMKIMDYFRSVAVYLARENLSLKWTTPDGCQIEQRYVKLKDTPVRTFDNWMRRIRKATDEVQPSKMAGAAAPNIVHSLDACMVRMVANRLYDQGIRDMAFVHDSYAVHAANAVDLNVTIRDVAVELFKGNWINDEFASELKDRFPDVDLPEPPSQGELDVESELPGADYFFS